MMNWQTCSTALYTRHLDIPFDSVRSLLDLAQPMGEVHRRLSAKLARVTEVDEKERKLREVADQLGVDIGDL